MRWNMELSSLHPWKQKERLIERLVAQGMDAKEAEVTGADTARERYLVQVYLRSLLKTKAGKMLEELENSLNSGHDHFPLTLADAHTMVANRKDDPRNLAGAFSSGVLSSVAQQGVAFVSAGKKDHQNDKSHYRNNSLANSNGNAKNDRDTRRVYIFPFLSESNARN